MNEVKRILCMYCKEPARADAIFCPHCRQRLIDRNGNFAPVLLSIIVGLLVFYGGC